jgi:hypothetical protein
MTGRRESRNILCVVVRSQRAGRRELCYNVFEFARELEGQPRREKRQWKFD